MIYNKQLYKHNPPESYGDCSRTVIACILNLSPSEVPNFSEGLGPNTGEQQHERTLEWLRTQGYAMYETVFDCDLQTVLNYHRQLNPDIYYMLTGKSKNGTGHVVVCKNDEIVWDPAIDDSGIVGPADDGLYWVSVLIPLITKEVLESL